MGLTALPAVSQAQTVSGVITLEGCTQPAQLVLFLFVSATKWYSFTRTLTLASDGSYSFSDIPPDFYHVTVKGSRWLAVVADADNRQGNATLSVTLPAGDINGDNSVDVLDFGLLVNAYGSRASDPNSGYNAAVDLNGDGVVDVLDFGLLVNNYGQSGASMSDGAQIPKLQIAWTKDHTVWPSVTQYSSSGVVGGELYGLITFPPDDPVLSHYIEYNVTKVVCTDKSGFLPPINLSAGYPYYLGNPLPDVGERTYPDGNGQNASGFLTGALLLNGDYTMTVSSTKTIYLNGQYVTTPLPDQSINFTIANPCITKTLPADADPVLWNPTAPNAPSTVPITITVDNGCYRCKATVYVEIIYHKYSDFYNAIGSNDQEYVTLSKQVVLNPGENMVTFDWDGHTFNPGTVPAGAYTFDAQLVYGYWPASQSFNNTNGYYPQSGISTLRSDYETVNYGPVNNDLPGSADAGMYVGKVFDDGMNALYLLQYTVKSRYGNTFGSLYHYTDLHNLLAPPNSLYDGIGGEIAVYNGATKVLAQQLDSSDVTRSVYPNLHSVYIKTPSQAGDVTFILSAEDAFAPAYDSHNPHYLPQPVFRGQPTIIPGVYFDRSLIKVGHGPKSGTQTVHCYVTPYSKAVGMTFATTKSAEATITPAITGFPPHKGNDTADITLTITGNAGTPVGSPNGDCQITANNAVPSGSPKILVLIPTRLSKTHQQFPKGVVRGVFGGYNNTTIPVYPKLISTPGNPPWEIFARWIVPTTIMVWDQFGNNLDSIYAGAEVDEEDGGSRVNTNLTIQPDGTYIDPVGIGVDTLYQATKKDGNTPDALAYWQTLSADALISFDDQTFTPENLYIIVDGNRLQSGLIGRVKKTYRTDPTDSNHLHYMEIIWPDTP